MIKLEYREYLDKILNEYYSVHLNPEHNITKSDLLVYIEEYINDNDITNNYEFRIFILKVLKKLNGSLDNHTCLECRYSLPLPFELKYLQDGFYVVESEDEDIKFSKLESINGISIKKICDSLEKITSYETIYWLYLKEQQELKDMYFLRMLPEIGNDTTEFTYNFVKNNNIICKKYNRESSKWINSKNFEDNATYQLLDDKIVYKLNSCMKDEKYNFKNKIDKSCKEINNILENGNITEFILDLRGNSGGSDTILNSLYSLFDKFVNKIIFKVLVDRETFSCGTIVLRYLLERGNILVIGEGVGEPFNDFGNFNNIIELGDCFKFHASNKYYCFNNNHLVWTSNKDIYNDLSDEQKAPLDYIPDIVITESIDDIMSKRDIVLENAILLKENV